MRPEVLTANQPTRFYRGGGAIAGLRGEPAPADAELYLPEDWVASTTPLFAGEREGLTPRRGW